MNDTLQQLTLFSSARNEHENKLDETVSAVARAWQLYIDGASRNNPGLSGAGIYIVRDGSPLYQSGYFLGTKTNNQAEYLALLLGLFNIKKWYEAQDSIAIFSDSQLLVRQLQGAYKVRNDLLKPLHSIALSMMREMQVTITHVRREDNVHADKMANHGIDTKKPMPSAFIKLLEKYDVAL